MPKRDQDAITTNSRGAAVTITGGSLNTTTGGSAAISGIGSAYDNLLSSSTNNVNNKDVIYDIPKRIFSEVVDLVKGTAKEKYRAIQSSRTYLRGSDELASFNANFGLVNVSQKDDFGCESFYNTGGTGGAAGIGSIGDLEPIENVKDALFKGIGSAISSVADDEGTKKKSHDQTTLFFDEILNEVLQKADFPRRRHMRWKEERSVDDDKGDLDSRDHDSNGKSDVDSRSRYSLEREQRQIQAAILKTAKNSNFSESFKMSNIHRTLVKKGKKSEIESDLKSLHDANPVPALSDLEDSFESDPSSSFLSSSQKAMYSPAGFKSSSPCPPSPLLVAHMNMYNAGGDNFSRAESPSKSLLSPRSYFLTNHIKIGLPSKHLIVLKNALYGNSDTLNLSFLKIDDSICKLLAKALSSIPSSMSILNLSNNSMSDKNVALILESIFSNKSIKEINLSSNTVGMRSIEILNKLMNDSKCGVKKLQLDDTSLDDFTLSRLLSSLYFNKSLEELSIANNNVGKGFLYGSAVGNSLLSAKADGDISVDSNFSAAGNANNICVSNQFHEIFLMGITPLKALNISNNIMKAKNGEVLCKSLGLSKYITHLDMSNNGLNSSMGILLADCLLDMKRKNGELTLKSLNLSNNALDNLSSFCLLIGIQNYNLDSLDISSNPIGFHGSLLLVRLAQYTAFHLQQPRQWSESDGADVRTRPNTSSYTAAVPVVGEKDEYRELKKKLGYTKLPSTAKIVGATSLITTRCDMSIKTYKPQLGFNSNNVVSNINISNADNIAIYKNLMEQICLTPGSSIIGTFQLNLSDVVQRFFAIYILQATASSSRSNIVSVELTGQSGGNAPKNDGKEGKKGATTTGNVINLKRKFVRKHAASGATKVRNAGTSMSPSANDWKKPTSSSFDTRLDFLKSFKDKLDDVLLPYSTRFEGNFCLITRVEILDVLKKLGILDHLGGKIHILQCCIVANDSSTARYVSNVKTEEKVTYFEFHEFRNFLVHYYEICMGIHFNNLFMLVYVESDARAPPTNSSSISEREINCEYAPPDSGILTITTKDVPFVDDDSILPFTQADVQLSGIESLLDSGAVRRFKTHTMTPDMTSWLSHLIYSNPKDADLIVYMVINNYNFYLFEAISLLETMNAVLFSDYTKNDINSVHVNSANKLMPYIIKIIPKLVLPKDSYYILKYFSQFELMISRELKASLGNLFNPLIYDSYSGYYNLNLSKDVDRTCLNELMKKSYFNKIARTKQEFNFCSIKEKRVESRVLVASAANNNHDVVTAANGDSSGESGVFSNANADADADADADAEGMDEADTFTSNAQTTVHSTEVYESKVDISVESNVTSTSTPLFDVSGNGDFTCFRNVRLNGDLVAYFDCSVYSAMRTGTLEFDFVDWNRRYNSSVTVKTSTSIDPGGIAVQQSSSTSVSSINDFSKTISAPIFRDTLIPDYKIDFFIEKYLITDTANDSLAVSGGSPEKSENKSENGDGDGSTETRPAVEASASDGIYSTDLAKMVPSRPPASSSLATVPQFLQPSVHFRSYSPIRNFKNSFIGRQSQFMSSRDQTSEIFESILKMDLEVNRRNSRKIQMLYSSLCETTTSILSNGDDSDEEIKNTVNNYIRNGNKFDSSMKIEEAKEERPQAKEGRTLDARMKEQEKANKKKNVITSLRKSSDQQKLIHTLREIVSTKEMYFSGLTKDTKCNKSKRCDAVVDSFLIFIGFNAINCYQLTKLLSKFSFGSHQKTQFGSYRVELVCSLISRIVDMCNFSDIFQVLDSKEISALYFRLGFLSIFNPLKLDGTYMLNLSKWDQSQVAKMLVNVICNSKTKKIYQNEAFYNAAMTTVPAPTDNAPMTAATAATVTTGTAAAATGANTTSAANATATIVDPPIPKVVFEQVAGWEFDPKLWSTEKGIPTSGCLAITIDGDACEDLKDLKQRFALFAMTLSSPLELYDMLDDGFLALYESYMKERCQQEEQKVIDVHNGHINDEKRDFSSVKGSIINQSLFCNPELLMEASILKLNEGLPKIGIEWRHQQAADPAAAANAMKPGSPATKGLGLGLGLEDF